MAAKTMTTTETIPQDQIVISLILSVEFDLQPSVKLCPACHLRSVASACTHWVGRGSRLQPWPSRCS